MNKWKRIKVASHTLAFQSHEIAQLLFRARSCASCPKGFYVIGISYHMKNSVLPSQPQYAVFFTAYTSI